MKSDTLWKVAEELCPQKLISEDVATISFIHTDIIGKSSLDHTTIAGLGVREGELPLRLYHRFSDTYVPEATEGSTSGKTTSQPTSKSQKSTKQVEKGLSPSKWSTSKDKHLSSWERTLISSESETEDDWELDKNLPFLSDRNGLVFPMGAISISHDNLLMDSFELSMDNVMQLQEDSRSARSIFVEFLEDEMDLIKADTSAPDIRIRIVFPDGVVLQGLFRPNESIGDVVDFIRKYLEDPYLPFYLYIKNPKKILENTETFFELSLTSKVILYFGMDIRDVSSKEQTYLRGIHMANMVSRRVASRAAKKIRENRFSNTKTGIKHAGNTDLQKQESLELKKYLKRKKYEGKLFDECQIGSATFMTEIMNNMEEKSKGEHKS